MSITLEPLHLLACVSYLLLPPVNCSDPTPPMDGSIDPYQNTTEGAEIFFRCNPGFVPAGRMTATCASNGVWTPDPASFTCTREYIYYAVCIFLGSSQVFATEKSLGARLSYTCISGCTLNIEKVRLIKLLSGQ